MNELVSIIVPVYNAEDTLARCLDSLLCQTYRNIEIILIDDGSADNSHEICKAYAARDPRINVYHYKNHGVSFARNQGILHAHGDYITFVDSDDYVKEELVEILLERMISSNADLVVSALDVIDGAEDFCINGLKEHIEQVLFLCRNYLIFGPAQKLYRTDKIGEIRFPENFQYGEDLLFNLKYLGKVNKICFINQQMYFYCRRPDSLSGKVRWDMFDNDMALHQKLLGWFKERDMLTDDAVAYLSSRVFDTVINSVCLMFRSDCTLSQEDTKEYYRKIVDNKLVKWSFKRADKHAYSKWQVFLITHKLVNLLTAVAMIERRR